MYVVQIEYLVKWLYIFMVSVDSVKEKYKHK